MHFYFARVAAAASAAFAVVLHTRRRRAIYKDRLPDWTNKIAKDRSGISKTLDEAEFSQHAQGVGKATLA